LVATYDAADRIFLLTPTSAPPEFAKSIPLVCDWRVGDLVADPVLHGPYLSWIRKSDGKAITRKLTPDQEQRYRPWFDNSRRLHELITELQTLSVQIAENAEGWQRPRP
jgi:hypothetical protein